MPADGSKKTVLPGLVDIDKEVCAVVVHYEIYDATTNERTKHVKRYRLKRLHHTAEKLADDVLRQSNLIPPSKRKVLEMLIANLQEYYEGNPDVPQRKKPSEKADLEKIDEYIEMLYEDETEVDQRLNQMLLNEKKTKVYGTEKILELAVDVGNLETLAQHQTLMGAISRVFAEEYRRSMHLTYNIARFFLALANFAQMHPLLSQHRVGSVCCDIVDYEVKRAEHRRNEKAVDPKRGSALQKKQDKVLQVCLEILFRLAEDPAVEQKMVKKNIAERAAEIFAYSKSVPLLTLTARFLQKLVRIESTKDRFQQRKGIAKHLGRLVTAASSSSSSSNENERTDLVVDLLGLVLNLSFDKTIRGDLFERGFIGTIFALLRGHHKFREKGIRILYHLSVDGPHKKGFAAVPEAVPIVSQLLLRFPGDRKLPRELVSLAVNLALDPACAAVLTADRKTLFQFVERVERTQDALLMKVIRNLALWTFNVQQDDENKPEEEAKQREMTPESSGSNNKRTRRGSSISFQDDDDDTQYPQRGLWGKLVQPILSLAMNADSNHDMLVEALGTLGNLTHRDLPRGTTWAKIVDDKNLTGFLSKLLVPGMAQHDVVLEAIIFAGVLAQDPDAAALIASSSLARSLEEVWRDRGDDSEIVLQLLFTFQHLLACPDTHDELLYNSRVLLDILDCLDHPNATIIKYADACLDLVVEYDRDDASLTLGDLGAQVRRRRFQAHNRDWLDIIASGDKVGLSANYDPSGLLSSESDSMSPHNWATTSSKDDDFPRWG